MDIDKLELLYYALIILSGISAIICLSCVIILLAR